MGWVLLVAIILAFPIMAVVAFFKSRANEAALERTLPMLRELNAQVAKLRSDVESLRAGGTAAPAPTVPAAAEIAERIQPEEAAPSEPVQPAPPPPVRPSPVPAAAAIDSKSLEEALTSRWFVWVGALAIALSGTFLVKHAIDQGWLGPTERVTLGFLLGVSLIVGGEYLRRSPLQLAIAAVRPNYIPPSLTAAGVFIAFASIYAAYALYALLGPLAAFAGLAVIALAAVGLSLVQGMFVALLGLLGAFLAPALVSSAEPSAWTLFPYLIVVQAACVAVARYRGQWWFALATLAGAALWPLLWLESGAWDIGDEAAIGPYLLVTAVIFYLGHLGWETAPDSDNWLDDVRRADWPVRTVWIASAAVAFLFFAIVAAADHSVASLACFGVFIVGCFLAGRRETIFDAMPVLAAAATLAVIAVMPMPDSVAQPHPVLPAPLVPPELSHFVGTCIAFGVLFAGGGFAMLWGARRPAIWAGVSSAVPVLLLVIAYWRILDFEVSFRWTAIALALAMMALLAAGRVERYWQTRALAVSLGFYAAAVTACLSLGATMSLRQAWLTVALSAQLPVLAWISQRIPGRSLRILAAIIAGIVLVRLVLNHNIIGYMVAGAPPFNWVTYGYGLPAIAFFLAARTFRKTGSDHLITLLEAGALAFGVLLVSLQIRLFIAGTLDAPGYRLTEQCLQSIAWLSIGTALAVRYVKHGGTVPYYGARILLGLAVGQIVLLQLIAANPIWTQDSVGAYPLLNVLLLAYAIPAAFVLRFAYVARTGPLAAPAAILGFVLTFVWLTLEVRHAFQGPILYSTHQSTAEFYSYSVAWLLYALALLGLGIYFQRAALRYASIAVLVITVVKVFLFDMDGLSGLFRVASFLGLGLSLVGIGYLYQRFVFRRGEAASAPGAV
jgi:uncharacterized membrane protein